MQYILVVEDDIGLNKGVCKALRSDERSVVSCTTIKEAREQAELFAPSLILLDENLPDGNGIDYLTEIKKQNSGIKVIMVTANDTDMDIVAGLESGADDYITKPFSLAVLRARVNTQLKSCEAASVKNSDVYSKNEYEFDFLSMIFKVNGNQVELSKIEQKLLYILVQNENMVMKRDVLIDRVWTDGGDFVDENALSVAIKRLRAKLSATKYIKTVYGLGYEWSFE
ncbi:MAG: response regulator transcription factor [Clostridia bacterium]|nr:response regulator transcription factor [Clostridia bacterium]